MAIKRVDWRAEAREAMRKEAWSTTGANRPVKVLPLNGPLLATVGGYFTIALSLLETTPLEIQKKLGLPPDSLVSGARIYNFQRLPQISEYEYELTAKYPDGLVHSPFFGDSRYGPGSDEVHQWRLKPGISIATAGFVELLPGQRFVWESLSLR